CEEGFFSVDESRQVLEAGMRHGLVPKIHANQLHLSGGVQLGVALGALSVDHLEQMDAAAIETLAGSNTIGTLLPTAAMFLRMPYPPARALVQAGCAIALASDYNPGSSPSGNMNLVVALSCINMRLTPVQAMLAATTNAAHAMQVQHLAGSIAVGKRANLILTRPVPNMEYLPYAFGHNHIEQVFINGQPWQPQRL
ncbi:MAG TPA: amidohydrolase family protein, partial [Phnomibacter sp.]|nr:amidohydrolase family protein [Phnomibacter sp.]